MPDLTDKQARFVEEYLVDLNATQAAVRAGYSEDSAGRWGTRT
jgi:phage terminase small subunit